MFQSPHCSPELETLCCFPGPSPAAPSCAQSPLTATPSARCCTPPHLPATTFSHLREVPLLLLKCSSVPSCCTRPAPVPTSISSLHYFPSSPLGPSGLNQVALQCILLAHFSIHCLSYEIQTVCHLTQCYSQVLNTYLLNLHGIQGLFVEQLLQGTTHQTKTGV